MFENEELMYEAMYEAQLAWEAYMADREEHELERMHAWGTPAVAKSIPA